MTVYVDELKVWGPSKHRCFAQGSSHMLSDRLEELHALAARIGLKRSWFQDHPVHPHYDLSPAKRELALAAGAVFVPQRQQIGARLGRRVVQGMPSDLIYMCPDCAARVGVTTSLTPGPGDRRLCPSCRTNEIGMCFGLDGRAVVFDTVICWPREVWPIGLGMAIASAALRNGTGERS